jgi:hypothetical protein
LRNATIYLVMAVLANLGGMLLAEHLNVAEKFSVGVLVIVFAFVGLVSLWKDIRRSNDNHYDNRKRSDAITEESQRIHEMHGLPEAFYMLEEHHRSDLVLDMTGKDPVFMIAVRTNDGLVTKVPSDFAEKYFANDDIINLTPVREYNGNQRIWAQALIQNCVNHGWAIASAGNQSAKWNPAGKSRAIRAMRLDKIKELKA